MDAKGRFKPCFIGLSRQIRQFINVAVAMSEKANSDINFTLD